MVKKIVQVSRIPTPLNISYLWGNGSILGVIYIFQIIRGRLLASLFTTGEAFFSVDMITRDI